jgi:Putative prokaryotic signal transducing protein
MTRSREPSSDYVEPVCVRSVLSRIQADLIVEALKASGVRVFAAGSGLEGYYGGGGLPGGLTDIRIMVHPDDVDVARQVLAEAEEGPSNS